VTFVYTYNSISTEKNSLIGLNSTSEKWTNQNFLVKSTKILVEIKSTKILIDIIILIKIRILVDFTKNIVSTKIPIISTRIVINLIRKF